MALEKDVPAAETPHEDDSSEAAEQVSGKELAMPQEDDPAGDGHMFTPGPDWPPARLKSASDEKDMTRGEND